MICCFCFAQEEEFVPFEMSLHLSAHDITLPDKLVVTAIITYPKGHHIDKNAIEGHLLKKNSYGVSPFLLLETKENLLESEKKIVETIEYFLEPQMPGNFPISLREIFVFEDNNKNKATGKIISDIDFVQVSLPKKVQNIDTNFALPLDLNGNLPLQWDVNLKNAWLQKQNPIRQKNFPWHLIVGSILMGIGFYAIRKKPLEEKPIQKVPRSVEEYNQAVKILADMSLKPPLQEDIKRYVTFLSNALRCRFEEHFSLEATTKTSEEFLFEVQEHQSVSKDVLSELKRFLSITDSIKFANYSLNIKESKELEKHASFIMRKLVKKQMPGHDL